MRLLLLLLLLLHGCASAWEKITPGEMAPRLEYQGFSFPRPPRHWYILRSEQSHTDVTLRRDLEPESPTHTFYARVALGGLERQPATAEELAGFARIKGQIAPYRIQRLEYEQKSVTRQGQWCIRFDSRDEVRDAPGAGDQVLIMRIGGYRCLHPAWSEMTLDFYWSERGTAAELDDSLAREGEQLIDGVRIDVAPDTPAR